ncbi:hypothetical protein CN918_26610 [Priestia megaterium]|nr:hypothetical protein CN918_26610 [Priestia megaterium]
MNTIYLFMGLPFSGKSTLARTWNTAHIEVDEVRKTLTGTYKIVEGSSAFIADVVYQSARLYLERKEDVIVEGMFLTQSSRFLFIELAKSLNASIELHWFDPGFSWIQDKVEHYNSIKPHISMGYVYAINKRLEFPDIDEGFNDFFYYNEKDFS